MEITRRKFIKGCLATAGLVALNGCGLRAFAGPTRGGGDAVAFPFQRAAPPAQRAGGGQSYLALEASGELERRERALWDMMEQCSLCPRMCGVNRMANRTAACSTGITFRVASHGPHFGEERVLVGRGGSGTIFFSNCNLLCVFCQNWTIAHRGDGRVTSTAELANMMLALQRRGCHNINFVTPTHILPHVITALRAAIAQGLNIPLLYNTSGYERPEVIRLLDGIIDIYLPDFKFWDSEWAATITRGAPDYQRYTSASIKEMHRQVGFLQTTGGIATQGLLIRHLVMPANKAGTDQFARWAVSELGAETHVNIMGQYSPQHQARLHPPLDRRPTPGELNQAMHWAREAGLRNFH